MKRYIIFLILATIIISSVPLFSATREEAIEYYESTYGDWLDVVIRHKVELGPADLMPDAPSSEAFKNMAKLGLLSTTTKIQLCNRAPMSVKWKDYYYIQDILSTISDEEERWEEEAKIASALSVSKNFNLPFKCALENLDAIEKAYSKVEGYAPTPSKGRETLDSIRDFFDESYETTWEKHDKAKKSQEDFERFLDNLRDNWYEI